jgi:protoporphyrinogen oxidase
MGEIPEMIKRQLTRTTLLLNTPVAAVEGHKVVLADGSTLEADRVIVAVQPDRLMKQLEGQFAAPRQVINLYFAAQKSFIGRPMIGLLAGKHLINNLVFLDDVSKEYAPSGKSLLSVTVLESDLGEKELIKAVLAELETISGVKSGQFKHLKTYRIPHALPQVDDLRYSMQPTECKVVDRVYLAGDYLLNGSINAAMTSGRTAAQAVIHSLAQGD